MKLITFSLVLGFLLIGGVIAHADEFDELSNLHTICEGHHAYTEITMPRTNEDGMRRRMIPSDGYAAGWNGADGEANCPAIQKKWIEGSAARTARDEAAAQKKLSDAKAAQLAKDADTKARIDKLLTAPQ